MTKRGPYLSKTAGCFLRWALLFATAALGGAALSLCARNPLDAGGLPSDFRGAMQFLRSACLSDAVLLAAAALFMPSALCRPVLAAAVLWRGAAFGFSLGLSARGLLALSSPAPVFVFALAASCLLLALAALTERLSAVVCRQACRPRRAFRLMGGYLRRWAVFSGGVFLCTLLGACFL